MLHRASFLLLSLIVSGCASTNVSLCAPGQPFALNTDTSDPRAMAAKGITFPTAPPVALPAEPPMGMKRIKVYFATATRPDTEGCPSVQYVERDVSPGSSLAVAAIAELIKGPTSMERSAGFLSAFDPSGTELKDVVLRGDLADVRFVKLKTVAGDPCTRGALKRQVISTVTALSLPSVKKVGITPDTKDWK